MQLANGMGHLTYSTLVHAGDTWDEIWASLCKFVPSVKKKICPTEKFGASLRISGATSENLANAPKKGSPQGEIAEYVTKEIEWVGVQLV